MDEKPGGSLLYGQVGRAVYLPETQAWTFSRSFDTAPPLSHAGVTRTVVPSPHNDEPRTSRRATRPPDEGLIPHAHPDLAAHWSLIRDDAFSKLVTAINSVYDPQVSSLLDVGYAWDNSKSRLGAIPIAAVVTGTSGNTISFRMMVDQETEYEGTILQIPSIGDTDTTEWSSQGAPIRQICFARSADIEDKAILMAARLSQSTVVFHPIYQRDPMPMYIYGDNPTEAALHTLQNSRLDANPVVEIPHLHTGGFPHADVAFNPWYYRQVAIVDTGGNWSVWELSGRQRHRQRRQKHAWLATPGPKGSLPGTSDNLDAESTRHDGWASIIWVADFSTILVSDRRCAMLYQISGDNPRSTAIELEMAKQSEWVLDVQRSTQNASNFFLLTTSRLLWFDLTSSPLDDDGMRPSLRSRFCWRHFRDPEDTTLRITELLTNASLNLVLYSRLAGLVQVFPCPSVVNEEAESVIVSDPFLLDVPSPVETSVSWKGPRVQFSNFVFREVAYSLRQGDETPCSRDMTLIKLFWIDSSLATHETIFRARDKVLDEEDLRIEDDTVLEVKKPAVSQPKTRMTDDDFVVDDWDESVVPPHVRPRQIAPEPSASDLQWTLNWASIYTLAVADSSSDESLDSSERRHSTFDQIIESLQKDVTDQPIDWRISETILELSGGRPVLGDIDQNAHDLARLVDTVLPATQGPQHSFMTLPSHLSSLFHGMPANSSESESPLDLLKTYDSMINEWLTSLSPSIPNSTRRMKEKVIRGVALDLILARLVRISNRPSEDDTSPSRVVESADADQIMEDASLPDQGLALPVSSSQVPGSSQVLEDPGSTTRGTDAQRKPDEAPGAPPKPVPVPAYSNLSAFTTFKEPRPMPRNVTNLLSHWQIGVDPTTYEWQRTTTALEEEEAQRTSVPSTPRRRARKKRSQQPLASEVSVLPPTPVAPMIRAWGSQPGHAATSLASSQPTLNEVPMTQTERGQFGMREGKKSSKAKKKRAAGF